MTDADRVQVSPAGHPRLFGPSIVGSHAVFNRQAPAWATLEEIARAGGQGDDLAGFARRPGEVVPAQEAGRPRAPFPQPQPSAPVPPAKVPEPAEYLSIATAAQYLDCSEGLIRKLLAAPDPMPSVTLGRARRIPRAALDAWIIRRMAEPVGVNDVLASLRARR